MGFPFDVEELHERTLICELNRRKNLRERGLCDYCGQPANSEPICRFSERHAGTSSSGWLSSSERQAAIDALESVSEALEVRASHSCEHGRGCSVCPPAMTHVLAARTCIARLKGETQ